MTRKGATNAKVSQADTKSGKTKGAASNRKATSTVRSSAKSIRTTGANKQQSNTVRQRLARPAVKDAVQATPALRRPSGLWVDTQRRRDAKRLIDEHSDFGPLREEKKNAWTLNEVITMVLITVTLISFGILIGRVL